MKDLKKVEDLVRDFTKSRQSEVRSTPEFDRRVLNSALVVHQENLRDAVCGRIDMRKAGIVAAVLLLLFIGTGLWFLHQVETPVYAAQIIEAIRKVETVHMLVEFYNQGEFECWMRFNGDPDSPSHFWAQDPEGTLVSKIGSPSGAYLLNPKTHKALFCSRDERVQGWIPNFAEFFENSLRAAEWNEAVSIKFQNASDEPIAVRIETKRRTQEILVDPNTHLPVRFTTIRDEDPSDMVRQTLAVRNIQWIRYNEGPPQGIFELPKDAVLVEKEEDCLIGPDTSMIADGMSPREASLAIAKRIGQGFVDMDFKTLSHLGPLFRLSFVRNESEQRKASGEWPTRYAIKGNPYQEGDHWRVPVEFWSDDRKVVLPMVLVIRVFQFEGSTYCTMVNWEKGKEPRR